MVEYIVNEGMRKNWKIQLVRLGEEEIHYVLIFRFFLKKISWIECC
jgi:hypothetical protein